MADIEGTCEYSLDPDDFETRYVSEEVLNEDGGWTCPHDTVESEDVCIFHLPLSEKKDRDVVEAFRTALDKATDSDEPEVQERKVQFVNATFGEFDLSEDPPDTSLEDERLALDYADIAGEVNWSSAMFDVCTVSLRFTEFGSEVDFGKAQFGGGVDFVGAEFGGEADFGEVQFGGEVSFFDTEFGGKASFSRTEFDSEASFSHTEFSDVTSFVNVVFDGEADFSHAGFSGDAFFRFAEFGGETDFRDAKFDAKTGFRDAEFDAGVDFSDAEFEEGCNFRDLNLATSRFENTDLTDATFIETNLEEASFESALLSRATLFGADLRGAKLSGSVLGDVRVDEETRFLGHPDDNRESSPHTLSAIRSKPCSVYDPNYKEDNDEADVDKAKSVYRALEELGSKHARPRLQTRSFVRRQDLQRDEYRQDAKELESLEERLIAGARWSRAKVARATLLYGESPWRVIAWSIGIILSFALLYPLGGWMKPDGGNPVTYAQIVSNPAEILNQIYYSTLIYTALGFGDFQPVGFGRVLTTIETGFGAVMLALLVFILGRRAAR